jgi:hypothetical protein
MSGGDWGDLDRAELERRHREACELLLASEQQLGRAAGELEVVVRRAEVLASELELERRRLAEREAQLADREAQLLQRDAQIADIVGSTSWQVTQPLRSLKSRLRADDR